MADEKTISVADHEAALAKVNDKIEELSNKYSGAMDDLKKAQRELRAAKDIKPEDLHAAEERADKAEKALADAQKTAKDATAAAEKATKALEAEVKANHDLVAVNGLKSALISNGVKDEDFIDSLTAKFLGGTTVVAEGDKRNAMYGDKPLGDFIKEWAGSDAGKKFVAAAANSGGGAPGGKTGEAPKTMLRSAFDALPSVEQHAFTVKEGGKVVDAAT